MLRQATPLGNHAGGNWPHGCSRFHSLDDRRSSADPTLNSEEPEEEGEEQLIWMEWGVFWPIFFLASPARIVTVSPSLHVETCRAIHPESATLLPSNPSVRFCGDHWYIIPWVLITHNRKVLFIRVKVRSRAKFCLPKIYWQTSVVGLISSRAPVHSADAVVVCPKL